MRIKIRNENDIKIDIKPLPKTRNMKIENLNFGLKYLEFVSFDLGIGFLVKFHSICYFLTFKLQKFIKFRCFKKFRFRDLQFSHCRSYTYQRSSQPRKYFLIRKMGQSHVQVFQCFDGIFDNISVAWNIFRWQIYNKKLENSIPSLNRKIQ